MKIIGIDGMTADEIAVELQQGGRFVIYQYCISIVVMTFKRPSEIYFVRAGQSPVTKGLGFCAVSLALGWWGFPWGPIFTITALAKNLSGGTNVTREVFASISRRAG